MTRRSELAQYAKRNGITEPVSNLEVGPGGVIYVLDDDEAGYRHHRNWSRAINSITLPRHNPAGGKPRPQRERGPA